MGTKIGTGSIGWRWLFYFYDEDNDRLVFEGCPYIIESGLDLGGGGRGESERRVEQKIVSDPKSAQPDWRQLDDVSPRP
jgi:hypothetical protein